MRRKNSTRSWRDQIKVHPAADLFPMMSDAELEVLSKDIAKHGLISRVTLWRETDDSRDVVLLDGRNRLDAMERAGVEVELPDGEINLFSGDECLSLVLPSKVDPYEYVIAANIHRRHLTPEQRRDVVAKLLKAEPQRSNAGTAKLAKVDDKTVASVRRQLEATSEVPRLDKTVGTDGKERPSRAKCHTDPCGRSKPAAPKQADLEEFIAKPRLDPSDQWTPSQLDRKALVEKGHSVVASMQNDDIGLPIDRALIGWAEGKGLLVNIDRRSDWGNPFEMDDENGPRDGDRSTVTENFRWYLDRKPSLQRRLEELRGKVLACSCHPEPCHGDVLCERVNALVSEDTDPDEIPSFLKRAPATAAAGN